MPREARIALVYLMLRGRPWASGWLDSNWGGWLPFWRQGYSMCGTGSFSLTRRHTWHSHPTPVMMNHSCPPRTLHLFCAYSL